WSAAARRRLSRRLYPSRLNPDLIDIGSSLYHQRANPDPIQIRSEFQGGVEPPHSKARRAAVEILVCANHG
ncbi:MAG: hypothetical protein P4N24_21820, partial [Acidobacteriota bacterium]|nr:hypothetical protein [Acidobacteriota bacterium]